MLKIRHVLAAVSDESGMTTAEYAIGTAAASGLAGILFKLLTGSKLQDILWGIIQNALSTFTN